MNVGHMRACLGAVVAITITACASSPPKLPYPAFIQADDLPDMFMASLPGIRAKQFAGDATASICHRPGRERAAARPASHSRSSFCAAIS